MASELTEIKYIGIHAAVDFDPDGFGEITVVKGETVKVPASEASSYLLQTANWELVSKLSTARHEETK